MSAEHTLSNYNKGCRCGTCKELRAQATREMRARAKERGVPEGMHGDYKSYSYYLCRCEACTDGWRTYCRNNRAAHPLFQTEDKRRHYREEPIPALVGDDDD